VETLFYFLALLQVLMGAYLVWHALQWLGYVRRRLNTDPGFYAPKVAVLCPCKGVEPGLERNLVSLTEFERQNYEIFFILANGSDAARSIIDRVAKNSRAKAHVVVAGQPNGCSEKVNNLRVAIEQLPPEFVQRLFGTQLCQSFRRWPG
jgi:cellulose synthase/poly-beta-1,6-N-acetylglucosamine synthase-like glycosyltransferase